jgi:hypothetical protein
MAERVWPRIADREVGTSARSLPQYPRRDHNRAGQDLDLADELDKDDRWRSPTKAGGRADDPFLNAAHRAHAPTETRL